MAESNQHLRAPSASIATQGVSDGAQDPDNSFSLLELSNSPSHVIEQRSRSKLHPPPHPDTVLPPSDEVDAGRHSLRTRSPQSTSIMNGACTESSIHTISAIFYNPVFRYVFSVMVAPVDRV